MRWLSRCPCCVACKLGGCLWRVLTLSPGNSGKIPCCSACCSVNNVGENRLACAKATIWAAVLPVAVTGSATAGDVSGIVHRPTVVGSRLPCRVVPLACVIVQDVLSKVAVHPASHSWPNNNSEVLPRSGKVNACVASCGRLGSGRLPTCVEYMWS